MSECMRKNVYECKMCTAPVPDHNAALVLLQNKVLTWGLRYWKLNVAELHDEDYVRNIEQFINNTFEEYDNCDNKHMILYLCEMRINAHLEYSNNMKELLGIVR